VYVAARLGLADLLVDGPATVDALAAECEADPPTLRRLLRALASLGVVSDGGDGTFTLAPDGGLLLSAIPGSLRPAALLAGERSYTAWGGLLASVRTGETAFPRVFGATTFEYMARHPELRQLYDAAMTAAAEERAAAVLEVGRFPGEGLVVDVGGGEGALLVAVLARHPALRGVVLERPAAVPAAEQRIARAGLASRARVEAGDFFERVPDGGDVHVLSHILHNWDDARCARILDRCRRAIRTDGRLLVVEKVMPERVEPSRAAQERFMADLHMLAITGGTERTEAEYDRLFAGAGFRLARVTATRVVDSLLEATVAG
jgi:cyclopropane fatty-acyl-phospholipid synthase-like methyltransferase